MAEAVEWGEDGTPRSPRFGDIYRSASGGLAQARHVFLQGCGLPDAWRDRAQWCILETGFGLGLNFLAAWQAWREDPQRPRLLHFVSIEAWPVDAAHLLRSAQAEPGLLPLAESLARQWWGLVPGFHRLSFEQGQVLLTLCVGDVRAALRELAMQADAVFLDGFSPQCNAAMWEPGTLKAVARLARRGTGLATWTVAGEVRRALMQCGFQVERVEGLPPKRECLRGRYDPAWEPKGLAPDAPVKPAHCAVIGAGLAGASVAASLARRGWQVEVLDAAAQPAAGASALPAGLMAPHQTPDDNPLSRLSRAGVRVTLQQAQALLVPGDDWRATGVLEHRGDDARLPPALGEEGLRWSRPAGTDECSVAGLAPGAQAWWHDSAAWIRPAALVRAWLGQAGVVWRGDCHVAALRRDGEAWRMDDAAGLELGRASLVVVAAALGSGALVGGRQLALHAVRGQVAWSTERPQGLPPFPVNGNGHFLPAVPIAGSLAWLSGSTYVRGDASSEVRPAEDSANWQRLQSLLPGAARELAPVFTQHRTQAWAGVRCASSDRRPLVGELEAGLWVSTAMGSRGLTFAALCAELLAAQLHGEPWPLEASLARRLAAARAEPGRAPSSRP